MDLIGVLELFLFEALILVVMLVVVAAVVVQVVEYLLGLAQQQLGKAGFMYPVEPEVPRPNMEAVVDLVRLAASALNIVNQLLEQPILPAVPINSPATSSIRPNPHLTPTVVSTCPKT